MYNQITRLRYDCWNIIIIIIIHEFHRDASLEQNFRVVVIMVVVLLLLLRASHTNTDGWIVCLQIATLWSRTLRWRTSRSSSATTVSASWAATRAPTWCRRRPRATSFTARSRRPTRYDMSKTRSTAARNSRSKHSTTRKTVNFTYLLRLLHRVWTRDCNVFDFKCRFKSFLFRKVYSHEKLTLSSSKSPSSSSTLLFLYPLLFFAGYTPSVACRRRNINDYHTSLHSPPPSVTIWNTFWICRLGKRLEEDRGDEVGREDLAKGEGKGKGGKVGERGEGVRGIAVARFLMKLFRTSNTEIIAECQQYFGFSLPSKLIERKRNKFVNNCKNVSLL